MYQRIIREGDLIGPGRGRMRYGIEAYLWDFSVHPGQPPNAAGVAFEATMYRDNEESFTLRINDAPSIQYAEAFFDEAWSALGMDLNPHND